MYIAKLIVRAESTHGYVVLHIDRVFRDRWEILYKINIFWSKCTKNDRTMQSKIASRFA